MDKHYAIIGMAHIADNCPLYYDALNEKGLCIAGLNFVGNAHYRENKPHKDNIAHYELILWLLGQCASVSEAKEKLKKINITNCVCGITRTGCKKLPLLFVGRALDMQDALFVGFGGVGF